MSYSLTHAEYRAIFDRASKLARENGWEVYDIDATVDSELKESNAELRHAIASGEFEATLEAAALARERRVAEATEAKAFIHILSERHQQKLEGLSRADLDNFRDGMLRKGFLQIDANDMTAWLKPPSKYLAKVGN